METDPVWVYTQKIMMGILTVASSWPLYEEITKCLQKKESTAFLIFLFIFSIALGVVLIVHTLLELFAIIK